MKKLLLRGDHHAGMLKKTPLKRKDNPEADHYNIASGEMCREQKARAEECK